jgi:hypothetical protein
MEASRRDQTQEWEVLKIAAERAGVNYSTARGWIRTGKVPSLPAPRSSGSKSLARAIDLKAYNNREQLLLPGIPLPVSAASIVQKKNEQADGHGEEDASRNRSA